jgi:NADH:ubiquinone oxidoreductase subunit K
MIVHLIANPLLISGKFEKLNYVLIFDFPSHLWFTIASFIFILGLAGLTLNNQNFLVFLLKVELMLIGINLFLIGVAYYTFDPVGLVYSILLFGIAASESVLGLSLFFLYFKEHNSINIVSLRNLN